jgi:hypothetical protein
VENNMRKWIKRTFIIPIAIILISLCLWAGFKVLGCFNYYFGKYLIPSRGKYYWCDPKELIMDIEDNFGHKFPNGIMEIKAAKTLQREGTISFLIRFTAEPNVVDAFFNSFPGEVVFNEYTSSDDMRTNFSSVPAWFKKPIRKGKMGYKLSTINPNIGNSFIYIDTANEKRYVVYWIGYYY